MRQSGPSRGQGGPDKAQRCSKSHDVLLERVCCPAWHDALLQITQRIPTLFSPYFHGPRARLPGERIADTACLSMREESPWRGGISVAGSPLRHVGLVLTRQPAA